MCPVRPKVVRYATVPLRRTASGVRGEARRAVLAGRSPEELADEMRPPAKRFAIGCDKRSSMPMIARPARRARSGKRWRVCTSESSNFGKGAKSSQKPRLGPRGRTWIRSTLRISQRRTRPAVRFACLSRVRKVSASGFLAWLLWLPSPHARAHVQLCDRIRSNFASLAIDGGQRIRVELAEDVIRVSGENELPGRCGSVIAAELRAVRRSPRRSVIAT